MAEIVVSRPAEKWANRFRSFKIIVDGKTVASLHGGEEASLSVGAGRHMVWARIDWGRSPGVAVQLGESDRAYLRCKTGFEAPNLFPKALLYATIWRKRYLDLEVVRVESSGV